MVSFDATRQATSIRCSQIGSDSILFQNLSTGEQLAASVRPGENGCFYLRKRLPSRESLRAGVVRSYRGIPEDVVFQTADRNGTQ
jgi:hypothetical protein